MCYCKVWDQPGAELCTDLECRELINDLQETLQRKIYLHRPVPAENVVGTAATGSVILPRAHSQYSLMHIKGVHYLSAGDVGVTKFPKCFWKVQYPLLHLLETPCIGANPEGANISRICLELRRAELAVKGSKRYR